MNVRRIAGFSLLIISLLVAGSLVFAGGGAAQTTQCQPIEERQLCFSEFTVSEETLVLGDDAEFSVTIENNGNASATGAVNLYTASPDNETNVYRVKKVTLEPGETETISRDINASTPGIHGLRFSLVETSTLHLFDTTEIETIEILEEHPKELGGPIDRTEIALVALIGSVLCMLGFGYRQVRN